MSYNWQDASTPQGRERIKELVGKGIDVIGREDPITHGFYRHNPFAVFTVSCSGRICLWDQYIDDLVDIEFLDPSPSQSKDENGLPTDGEISFVASDESNHHDWMDLGFRNTYQQGFEDGAKWMRNKRA